MSVVYSLLLSAAQQDFFKLMLCFFLTGLRKSSSSQGTSCQGGKLLVSMEM